ncbi:MAG: hypothetical protein FVQ82_02195 [Planctomycetes bacterium]|nr:hypothetical protein [Planctomycetota bacterium]
MLKRYFTAIIISILLSQTAFSGTISGTVTDNSDGSPIPSVWVRAYDLVSGTYVGGVSTDLNGVYTITGLTTSSYRVYVSLQQGFVKQYYNNKYNSNDADAVSVTLGATTSGIDFALAEGGTITGTVTDQSDGTPLSGMWVYAYDFDTGDGVSSVNTDSNGDYTLSGLPSGNYMVAVFSQQGFVKQYYNNKYNYNDADAVSVTQGATTGGINFALVEGGTITGRVTDATTGLGVGDCYLYVHDYSTGEYFGHGYTDPNGNYSVAGLPTSSYRVSFYSDENYVFQYYDHVRHWNDADSVDVVDGVTTDDIDFSILEGGSISGTVLDPNGLPVESVYVAVHVDSTGEHIHSDHTDANGVYTVDHIPPGSFEVRVEPSQNDFMKQYYDHSHQWQGRTAVDVSLGEDVVGIDFDLEVGASVSGILTDSDGLAVDNARIVAYVGYEWVTDAYTEPNGFYKMTGLIPDRDYRIAAYPPADSNDMITAVDRFVGVGETFGVDIQLDSGGLTISGFVTDKATGLPLEGVNVSCHIEDSAYDFWGRDCNTDPNGYYELSGLPPSEINMWLGFWNFAGDEDMYGRLGAEVELTGDLTVDFALPPAASYSGVVIDMATGEPVPNVEIEFDSEKYNAWVGGSSDAEGRFDIGQLAGGVFEVLAMPEVSSGYTFSMACPYNYVNVPEGADIEGRYIAVQKGALVTGRFVRGDGVTPISFAEFDFSADWLEGWGDVNGNGEFEMRLPPGNYDIALEIDDDDYSMHFQTVNIPDLTTPVSLGDIVMYSVSDGGQISGNVSNPTSVVIAGELELLALVAGTTITPDNWGHYWDTRWAEVSDTGDYTMTSLPPGTYDLYLMNFYETPEGPETGVIRDIVTNVNVPNTSTSVPGIDLVYDSEGGTVTGSVGNVYAEAIVGFDVVMNDTSTGKFAAFADGQADGTFTINNVEPGNYTLTASHRMYLPVAASVTVSEGVVSVVSHITLDFAGIRQGADVNGDGKVDVVDAASIAAQWLSAGPDSDFDDDGIVGLADFNVLSQMWMLQAVWRD